MNCHKCNKIMIMRYGGIFNPYPSKTIWNWWCKCGYEELAEISRARKIDENSIALWEIANAQNEE